MGWLGIHKGWTAAGITAARAIHCLYERPVIFEDDVAIHLLSPAERFLCQSKFVYSVLLNRSISEFKPYIFHSFSCQRYAEEQLAHALNRQLRQYVILGAGLDSFALRRRDLKSTLRVFEVDHPQSQLFKQRRIARSPYREPDNLEFVPVDFELESVLDGLERSSFDFGQPAFCSWMGTVMYLTEDAVLATLGALGSLAPGSEAHLDSRDLDERYLAGWEGLQTIDFGHLIHLGVPG